MEELRRLGHDVLTIQETGKGGQGLADDEVLSFAASEGRAVLTFNRRHFIVLHGHRPDHRGIVVCTVDPDFAGLAQRIDATVRTAVDLGGQLVRVNLPAAT